MNFFGGRTYGEENMATWITHLRMAEKFKRDFNSKEFNYFLIGNIAPDSGVVDYKTKTYIPSSDISHFRKKKEGRFVNHNLDFYFTYLKPSGTPEERAFFQGYFIHLFLDELYGHYLYRPLKKRLRREIEENPNHIWEIKDNWAAADFLYLENNREWDIWKRFSLLSFHHEWLDFYPSSYINSKLESVRQYYMGGRNQTVIDPFMSVERIAMFIELSYFWIKTGLNELINGRGEGKRSALDILEDVCPALSLGHGDLEGDFLLHIGEDLTVSQKSFNMS